MRIVFYLQELCLIIPISLLKHFHVVEFIIQLAHLLEAVKLQSNRSNHIGKPLVMLFLKEFNTIEQQEALRQAVYVLLPDINENNGRHWVVLYIAYTYAIGKRVLLEDYSLFFTDIESLVPGLLKNINPEASGYDRYSRYIDLLSKECKLWYICNGRLPDVSEWKSSMYVYQMKKERRNSVQELTTSLLQSILKVI